MVALYKVACKEDANPQTLRQSAHTWTQLQAPGMDHSDDSISRGVSVARLSVFLSECKGSSLSASHRLLGSPQPLRLFLLNRWLVTDRLF
jgi:hypothetical protein